MLRILNYVKLYVIKFRFCRSYLDLGTGLAASGIVKRRFDFEVKIKKKGKKSIDGLNSV